MLSEINANSNTSINPEQPQTRLQAYQLVQIQRSQFRVLSRQYQHKSSIISFWCVFWLTATITTTALLIATVQRMDAKIVLYFTIGSAIILLFLSLYLTNKIDKIIPFSIINFNFFIIGVSIIEGLSIKYFTIMAAVFISIQMILSLIYVKQKGKLLIQVILLAQFGLITAKLDGLVNLSWAEAFIPLIPFFAFIACAFIFVLIYTTLLYLYYRPTFQMKKIALIFLLSNLACFSSLLSLPLSWAFLSWDLTFLCILAMSFTSTNSIYLWINNSEIALNFCTHKNQVLESDKDIKIEVIPIINANRKKPLYRYSQNWFGHQLKDSLFQQNKYPQCLVCMQSSSDIIWLPCGHLALCSACCKDMIHNKMIHCMLCKQKPTKMCQVKQKDQIQIKLQRQMGFTNESKSKQELVIGQCQIRIS